VSKRFPVPEFDRDLYKNLPWTEPEPLPFGHVTSLIAAAKSGEERVGGYPVAIDEKLANRFSFKMEGQPAVMCVLPDTEVRVSGRSWAWSIQRAVIIDSLDAETASVIADWHTPRPMNTRLGPDGGIALTQRVVYILCGHKYAEHWIANRTLISNEGPGSGSRGLSVLSASDDSINDFHACNITFTWK
jgi:hypothetical protein